MENVEPWRDSGLGEAWVHKSGLEYRDITTIEAARSVARFAQNNQYLGSFKTRQGEVMIWEYLQLHDNPQLFFVIVNCTVLSHVNAE